MTGAVQTSAMAAAAQGYSLGIGTGGAGVFGFSFGAYGTISFASYKGKSITGLFTSTGGLVDLALSISGSPIQAIFNNILVQDTAGTLRIFTSASATFFPGATATWQWGTGASPVWTATVPTPRIVSIRG